MDTDAQAQAAIQGLNDHEHDGRRLTVDEAKPRVARTVGFAGGCLDGSARTGGGDGCGAVARWALLIVHLDRGGFRGDHLVRSLDPVRSAPDQRRTAFLCGPTSHQRRII